MRKFKQYQLVASALLLSTTSLLNAAVINHTFSGSITSWTDNPIGILPDTAVSLSIDYDDAWIQPKVYFDGQTFNVVNIIDFYDLGGRLTLTIGDRLYIELSSQNPVPTSDPFIGGWYNSIPYILFDNNNAPIGISSHWLDADFVNFNWDSQIFASNSNNIGISFVNNLDGTQGQLTASIDFSAEVPLLSSFWLLLSGLMGLVGIVRPCNKR